MSRAASTIKSSAAASPYYCAARRRLLQTFAGFILSPPIVASATSDRGDPARLRPQVDDCLVFASSARSREIIRVSDLLVGSAPLTAYPFDATSGIVRNRNRLNRLLVLRLASRDLTMATRQLAPSGIVAYSAVCPHTGCQVSEWDADEQHLICPCHASTFNAKDRARVVSGPAPRALAILPLKLVDEKILVRDAFIGRVGVKRD